MLGYVTGQPAHAMPPIMSAPNLSGEFSDKHLTRIPHVPVGGIIADLYDVPNKQARMSEGFQAEDLPNRL